MNDESGESMELMEEAPLKELGEAEFEISAWLTEGSRELIPQTRGSILEWSVIRSDDVDGRASVATCNLRLFHDKHACI